MSIFDYYFQDSRDNRDIIFSKTRRMLENALVDARQEEDIKDIVFEGDSSY